MKKIYAGVLLASILAQPIFGMEEERENDSMHTVVRSPKEQEKLNNKLLSAVYCDDLSRVQELIKQGADVNSKDSFGWSCLHWALCCRNNEAIKILLACEDIEVNVVDDYGKNTLNKACDKDNIEAVKLLLKKLLNPAVVSWQQERLVWIGHLKEEANCNLAKLPIEMICYILSFFGDKRNNIEALKSFVCHQDKRCLTAFNCAKDTLKKELGPILDPQAWQDDKMAEKTYDALVKLLKEDEKKQSNQNGLQQE